MLLDGHNNKFSITIPHSQKKNYAQFSDFLMIVRVKRLYILSHYQIRLVNAVFILQTVHSLTKYETPLVNLSPHPSLTLPYKGGKRSSFYDWRGFELGSLYDKKVQLLAVLSIANENFPLTSVKILQDYPVSVKLSVFRPEI